MSIPAELARSVEDFYGAMAHMDELKLEPGWLERQIKATKEEVATWPASWKPPVDDIPLTNPPDRAKGE